MSERFVVPRTRGYTKIIDRNRQAASLRRYYRLTSATLLSTVALGAYLASPTMQNIGTRRIAGLRKEFDSISEVAF